MMELMPKGISSKSIEIVPISEERRLENAARMSNRFSRLKYIILLLIFFVYFISPPSIVFGESSAIIVTVDGLSFVNTLLGLNIEDDDNYLKSAVESMNISGIPDDDIVPFTWSRDANNTEQELSLLRLLLRSEYQRAINEDKSFIVVAHSWGTFLSYIALSLESVEQDPIYCDLYVTLGSPLGTSYAHEGVMYPEEILVNNYVNQWLFLLDFDDCTNCSPLVDRSVNYWLWGDVISGPLGSFLLTTENIKLDLWSYEFGGYDQRNLLTTPIYHKYDSLQPGGIINNQVLKDMFKALIEETADITAPVISNILIGDVPVVNGGSITRYSTENNEINITGTDNIQVTGVVLRIDGVIKLTEQPSAHTNVIKTSYAWDTSSSSNGQYDVEIKAYDQVYNESSYSFTVDLQDPPPEPLLVVSPLSLSYNAVEGQNSIINKQISISNGGSGSITWNAVSNRSWLSVTSASGATPAIPDIVVDTSGLSSGNYSGAITISSSGIIGSPKLVNIYLTVDEAPPSPGDHFELSNNNQWIWDDDEPGNEQLFINGIPEGLETLEVYIPIRNNSGDDFQYVHAILSSSASVIDFSEGDDSVNYAGIIGGQTVTPDDDFCFKVSSSYYVNTPFTLHLNYRDTDGTYYYQDIDFNFTFTVRGSSSPNLSAGPIQLDDSGTGGDNDGIFESGEIIDFFVPLTNTGTADCVNPQGVLEQETTWGSDVFSDLINSYPDIAIGATEISTYDYDTYEAPKNFSGDINATMRVWYGPDRDKYQDVGFSLTVSPAPYMSVSPDSYDFGVAEPNVVVQVPTTIYSNGSADLSISSIVTDNSDTTISGASVTPFTIDSGSNQPITINIDTTGLNGVIQRTVTITSDNAYEENVQTITISGIVGTGGGETMIVGGAGHQKNPHLYEKKLVYDDDSSGNKHIYLKDLSNGNVTQLSSGDVFCYQPRIYENYIVWVQRPNGSTTADNELILLDLNDINNPTAITSNTVSDTSPRIWGDYIIYERWMTTYPSIMGDIFLYRISTNVTTQLTNTANDSEGDPEMHGDYAVWYDGADINRYTLSTGATIPIPNSYGTVYDISTYNGNVTWSADEDLYYYSGGSFNSLSNMPADNLKISG